MLADARESGSSELGLESACPFTSSIQALDGCGVPHTWHLQGPSSTASSASAATKHSQAKGKHYRLNSRALELRQCVVMFGNGKGKIAPAPPQPQPSPKVQAASAWFGFSFGVLTTYSGKEKELGRVYTFGLDHGGSGIWQVCLRAHNPEIPRSNSEDTNALLDPSPGEISSN